MKVLHRILFHILAASHESVLMDAGTFSSFIFYDYCTLDCICIKMSPAFQHQLAQCCPIPEMAPIPGHPLVGLAFHILWLQALQPFHSQKVCVWNLGCVIRCLRIADTQENMAGVFELIQGTCRPSLKMGRGDEQKPLRHCIRH